MIIQEAIKSSKLIRRTDPNFGILWGIIVPHPASHEALSFMCGNSSYMPLSISDILADDWEVDNSKTTLEKLKISVVYFMELHCKCQNHITDSCIYCDFIKSMT